MAACWTRALGALVPKELKELKNRSIPARHIGISLYAGYP